MKNETIELLYNRKSVRAYEKREIPEEDVQKILRAAIEAPTAGNMTLWSAIRVTDEAKKKRLSETCDNIERCEQQREILGLPEYVKPVCMVVYGIPTEFQKTRKKPARFEVEDIVFENEYQPRDPEQMRRMLENRQDKHGEELESWITAHCKRKWNCDFSREMTRSAAKMIQEWREGK